MPKLNKEVDTYIKNSASFGQPILLHLRKLVHKACPDVEEQIKWNAPFFEYKGILCLMVVFKAHCKFRFWKTALLKKEAGDLTAEEKSEALAVLDRITDMKELPSDQVILLLIKQAMKLNETGIKLPSKPKAAAKTAITTPVYFVKILNKNKKVKTAFGQLPPSHRKEYIQWFEQAKTEETRTKRITQAIMWLEEGKSKNWKYERKK